MRELLDAYRTADPDAWVATYRLLPVYAALLLVPAGAALLWAGGDKLFRVVAVPLGAFAGAAWVPVAVVHAGFASWERAAAWVGAIVLGATGLAYPPAVLFFAVGLPAGLVGGALAGLEDWIIGFVPALTVVGALAAVFDRPVKVVLASAVGAWGLMLGALTLLHAAGGPPSALLSHPALVLGAAGALAVAGAAYQLLLRPSPEEAARRRQATDEQARRIKERAELEARWANYSSTRGEDPGGPNT